MQIQCLNDAKWNLANSIHFARVYIVLEKYI